MARIDEAIEQLDVEDWLGQYVDVKQGGRNEIRLETCPRCHNSKYKLYVNVETKRWICFACTFGTHLSDVAVLMSEVSGRNLASIRKELVQMVIPAPSSDFLDRLHASLDSNKQVKKPEVSVTEVTLPGSDNLDSVIGQSAHAYATHSRGLTDAETKEHRLRVANKLRNFAGPFLVFPIYYGARPVGWQGRRISGGGEPKYVSSDDIADWFWPLNDDRLQVVRERKEVVLVEGVFDALGVWRAGSPAFCTFGKKISRRQVELLRSLNITAVTLAWDADALADIERSALVLKAHFRVRVADMSQPPVGAPSDAKIDPGEVVKHTEYTPWLVDRLSSAIDVSSQDFYNWRLRRALGGF